MGRIALKKGKAGNAINYLTRAQALRKLQVSLADFRRLCILKGIYPRDPKKKVKGTDKTYYHVKDIRYLMHEPLLAKFRELKAFMKKVKKALGKNQKSTAKRLEDQKPTYTLDHLLKERYPTFVSALGDLDDALCTLEIFGALPANDNRDIPANVIRESGELIQEFRDLVSKQRALKKTFVSIKGYYYQAEFLGQKITWLSPHKFAQYLPAEVDFRVLLTFLEFYRTLLKFVNFKLRAMIESNYFGEPSQGVFAKRTVFIAREVPRHAAQFILQAQGATVGWQGEGSPIQENDESITHHLVDRPVNMLGDLMAQKGSRDLVQPQWAFDSVNAGKLLPCVPYGPGRVCPAHLSPFIDDAREGYVPADRRVAQEAGESTAEGTGDLNGSDVSFDDIEDAERKVLGVEKPHAQKGDVEEEEEESSNKAKRAKIVPKKEVAKSAPAKEESEDEDEEESIDGDFEGVAASDDEEDEGEEPVDDSDLDEEDEEEEESSDEEEAPAAKKPSAAEKKAAEEKALRKTLLSSNQRKLYDAMTTNNNAKADRNKRLEEKRVQIEKQKTKDEKKKSKSN